MPTLSSYTSFAALYLHIPYCRQKCAYCDFLSWPHPTQNQLASCVHQLQEQVQALATTGLLKHCTTAYIGGGTPSLLGEGLVQLAQNVQQACPELAEFTCEANPDSFSAELATCLAQVGVTRISLGVQSTNDRELHALGRIHTAGQALQALQTAVASQLDVSCDLMCAIPHQTAESWHQSLDDVLRCGAQHVSIYPLQIEDGTPLARQLATRGEDEPSWNDPDIQASRMEDAERILTAAGLARYEVASYARPGKTCEHNIAYWSGKPYLGLGPGAASMLTRDLYEQLRELQSSLPEPPGDCVRIRASLMSAQRRVKVVRGEQDTGATVQPSPSSNVQLDLELEYLNQAQATAEDLMLAMRCRRGVSSQQLNSAAPILGTDKLSDALAALQQRELIRQNSDGSWVPTHQGWLLGNELFGRLWDLAPSQQTITQRISL